MNIASCRCRNYNKKKKASRAIPAGSQVALWNRLITATQPTNTLYVLTASRRPSQCRSRASARGGQDSPPDSCKLQFTALMYVGFEYLGLGSLGQLTLFG